jgi:glycerol-3-phosphate dehydrogenase
MTSTTHPSNDTRRLDARRRGAALARATSTQFDLVVIGGGINGAGIAHDAALRGLSVCLVEQRDLAFGTSSRSSKLIHGGLRYLEHYQFPLVFESTNERTLLRKLAPHLVRPLLFALPVYEGDRHPLWMIQVGMWMYDGLSLFQAEHRHVALRTPKRLLEREPLLRDEGLTGGMIYYDCLTDDARLTLENALAAARLGATVLTRARVVGVDGHHARADVPMRVEIEDLEGGGRHVIRARGVVNATGAWTDAVRRAAGVDSHVIRPTKGVHVVVPHERLPVRHAAALLTPQDGRVFFTIPWQGRTVIGTTDTDDASDPSALTVSRADVAYLLQAANRAFPAARLVDDDVIAAWVGLRPLVRADEAEGASASAVPREHQLFRDGRMISIAGGKLTTYRRMAAEAVDAVAHSVGLQPGESTSGAARLPGAIGLEGDLEALVARLQARSTLPADVLGRLGHVYGVRAADVLALVDAEPALAARLDPERDVIAAEVVFGVREELALSVEDVLVRRTSLALTARDQGRAASRRVAELMARELGWSDARRREELAGVDVVLDEMVRFRSEPRAEVG